MQYFGNLRKNLNKIAIRQILISLISVSVFLVTSIVFTNGIISYTHTKRNLNEVSALFNGLYENNKIFLLNKEHDSLYKDAILNNKKVDYQSVENSINRLNSNNIAKTNIILMDQKLNLIYSSYSDERELELRINYTRAIAHKSSDLKVDEIYNSVYKNSRGFSDLMMTKVIIEDQEVVGYLSSFVSGYDWSYYLLSNHSNDSIITDLDGNIIFYSKPLLLGNNYSFTKTQFRNTINGQRYSVLSKVFPQEEIKVHALTPVNDSFNILYTIFISVILGFIWYRHSNKTANMIIDNNIKSLNLLVEQLQDIKGIKYGQRIHLNTQDEYEFLANHINSMLDRMEELNQKNTDLINLNNQIEMKQLLSQYNPHFLYNTLEIIRSSYHWNPEMSDELIIKLSKILKYSINENTKQVNLREDLNYIDDYLFIQKARFSDRLKYTFAISEEAKNAMIPKLLLQPVIENSIKYGFEDKESVEVFIQASIEEDLLVLIVRDDGPGMKKEDIAHIMKIFKLDKYSGSSIGLYNIARRIYLQNPEKNRFIIKNNTDSGIEVRMEIYQGD